MPTWLIVVAVIVILVAAFALRARHPSDLERLGQGGQFRRGSSDLGTNPWLAR